MTENTTAATSCGNCSCSHEVPGIQVLWCEKAKVFTAHDAPACGPEPRKQDQVVVRITSSGFSIAVHRDGLVDTEEHVLEKNRLRQTFGDLEDTDPLLDEDLVDAILVLSVEAERVTRCLVEAEKRTVIAASARGQAA